MNEEDFTSSQKQAYYNLIDIGTKVFMNYGMWLCYIILLIRSMMPPCTILSLIYFVFLLIFFGIALLKNDSVESFKTVSKIWPTLIYLSLLIICLKYFFMFERHHL